MAKRVSEKKTGDEKTFVLAVGRRKSSVARVRIYTKEEAVTVFGVEAKKGDMFVNGKLANVYFPSNTSQAALLEPLKTANVEGKYILSVRVMGGGPAGQLDATIHGIARALSLLDKDKHRGPLKKKGFLTRDPRVRERRKVGTGGKARRKKQSPKR